LEWALRSVKKLRPSATLKFEILGARTLLATTGSPKEGGHSHIKVDGPPLCDQHLPAIYV
jgi:hypothetical protein